ncbi:hypothetical protein [Ammoniphilus resinae]|uniref:Uncharacterized protein n=1 Tax=Ammoniphilus resinae TaxID=861532 RepID=A0ABS4GJU1_9BACL|nr:hypothetical protein [Ammoniphilus resinae]MBP1930519.1 hypothetical protein [Ammoniphilus resinae]
MTTEKSLFIPEARIGKYKQSLADIHKWQGTHRKQNTPFLQILKWLMGN